jgi:putative lipase involved disintegration of autophagic bodies
VLATGHSLGGGLAAFVAHVFKSAAVTFAAPGDIQALVRLGVKSQPVIVHYGLLSDSIFMGACDVLLSFYMLTLLGDF